MQDPAKDGPLVTSENDLREIVEEIRGLGAFVMDFEFLSSDRYIAQLCLVQVAWGDVEKPAVAAIDPLKVDVRPLLELAGDADIDTVMHGAKQDLQILWEHFEIAGKRIWDTQIAAALLGIAEQIGYANLVAAELDIHLDKGMQFTDWSKRPLAEAQLRYALDDVHHLGKVWHQLREGLKERGRFDWVAEECAVLAKQCAQSNVPEEMYRAVKGWANLRGPALASLQAIAAWREVQARAQNLPPSWVLPDVAMVDLCRRKKPGLRDLRRLRGVKGSTVREHGDEILTVVETGARNQAPKGPPPRRQPEGAAFTWSLAVLALVQGLSDAASISARMVANRADVEDFVAWLADGATEDTRTSIALANGWRYELVGSKVASFLAGDASIVATDLGVALGQGAQ